MMALPLPKLSAWMPDDSSPLAIKPGPELGLVYVTLAVPPPVPANIAFSPPTELPKCNYARGRNGDVPGHGLRVYSVVSVAGEGGKRR